MMGILSLDGCRSFFSLGRYGRDTDDWAAALFEPAGGGGSGEYGADAVAGAGGAGDAGAGAVAGDAGGDGRAGWDEVDVVFVTGDAYVDHPSFANGILARVLEAAGFRVGVLAPAGLEVGGGVADVWAASAVLRGERGEHG